MLQYCELHQHTDMPEIQLQRSAYQSAIIIDIHQTSRFYIKSLTIVISRQTMLSLSAIPKESMTPVTLYRLSCSAPLAL